MDAPIIETRALHFSFGEMPVLADATLSIPRGDFACVVGPNGGGKTTLLRLVLGLLKPDGGSVRVFGRPPREVRRRVGYMPQHAQLDPLFPVRVLDVVKMGRLGGWRGFGSFSRQDTVAALAALDEVRLSHLVKRPFAALSGGQRQRVLIARALACTPELLLLDEPTANLDPSVQDDMTDLLQRLNQRLTVVLVSHDVGFVIKHVKTVVCVNRSVVVHHADELTGDTIRSMYGDDMQIVHHEHVHDHTHGPHHH